MHVAHFIAHLTVYMHVLQQCVFLLQLNSNIELGPVLAGPAF